MLIAPILSAQDYSFEDFPSENISQVALQQINFDSHPDSRNLESRLEVLIGSTPNFAGHYIATGFGCGTACQVVTIIDVITGDILIPTASSAGFCHSLNSQLLIINPYITDSFDGPAPDWANTYYYLMGNDGIELIAQTRESYKGECEFGP